MTKINTDMEIVKALHKGILLFQRRMRRARLDYNLPIGRDYSIILSMLSKNSDLNAGRIVSVLGITKTKVSRLLFTLEKAGYIKSEISKEDRRRKDIVFTSQGRKMLEVMIKWNNEMSYRGLYPAIESDFKLSEKVIRGLNDALEFPIIDLDPMEFALTYQQRRLASYSGMVGDDYMKLGFDISYMQVLFELSRTEEDVDYSHLDNVMPFHKTKLSSILSDLEGKGFIEKVSLEHDKRGLSCKFTNKGKTYYSSVETKIAKVYLPILERVSKKEILSFIELVKSQEHIPIPPPSRDDIESRFCKSEADYKLARAILVELLVNQGKHKNLSSNLIPKSFHALIFVSNSKEVGVLVLAQDLSLQYFETVYNNQDQASLRDNLYSLGMKEFKKNTPKKSKKS